MLKKNNFFKNFSIKGKEYNADIKKTKKIFESLKKDLKNSKIPLLESYTKDYRLQFSRSVVKKYSKYNNIIIIGMGGSIQGAKSIYSFLKKKIKKKSILF